MGVVKGNQQKEGHNIFKLATVACLFVAMLFHLIAIASPNWASADLTRTDRAEHIGLWKFCTYPYGGGETCYDFVDIIYGDWLKAAQSFMIISLFTLPAALGLSLIVAFVSGLEDDMRLIGVQLAVIGITDSEKLTTHIDIVAITETWFNDITEGLFTLTCVCSFGDRFQEYFNNKEPLWKEEGNIGVLGWGFGLAVTDMFLTFIALGCGVAAII
ncbi:hypothetical protein HELRODRAFT_188474 [Helobdella robusta]|uniref:Uncharacterized protein n=1 Tax=Helobdella robusta TaxID=6412 RepID=T1FQ12_HELRO|nr:hypothetical protein HELRODRAFT_188474 [Helobdella robusta]ESO01774.1 hypothetical protein HELRODRAFT_188474 [Helobdella robusta]